MHARIMELLFSNADKYMKLLVNQAKGETKLKYREPGTGITSEEWWRRDLNIGKLSFDAG